MGDKWTRDTLGALRSDLVLEALAAGRYPPGTTWERRDKSAAFRCIAYEQLVRRITALERSIAALETAQRSVMHLACIREACGVPADAPALGLAYDLRNALRQRDRYEGWLRRISEEQPPAIDDHSVWALRALRGEEAP